MSMSLNENTKATTGFVLTGWHVLAITLGFFGLIFAANGALVYYALESFPGTVTASSYQTSQTYNAEIRAAVEQSDRHWSVTAEARRSPEGAVDMRVDALDAAGQPLSGVTFTAVLERPTDRSLDRAAALRPKPGTATVYEGHLDGVLPGQWELVVEADGADGARLFLSRNRLVLR
jgi:nitrogen fixation protein FixH